MKKILTALLVCFSSLVFAQSTTVVISQAYGGGGNVGATFDADFVEIHNVSAVSQSLSGYSIQYGSGAANNFNWSSSINLPSVVIPSGGYFLIKMSASGTNGSPLPSVDFTASPAIAMGGTAGKIALLSDTNRLISGSCPISALLVDLVGYGSTAACKENTSTGDLSAILSASRINNGCTDTDNNLNDFALGTPDPRNAASTAVICGTTPTGPTINTTSLASFGFVCLNLSRTNSFIINGSNLSTGNIDLASLSGFEYSLSDAGPFSSSLSIPQAGGSFSDTVFVKFTPIVAINYSGNIIITGGGIPAPVNLIVSANGLAPAAPTTRTNVASAVTGASATLNGQVVFINCDSADVYGFLFDDNSGFTSADTFLSSNLASGNFSYDVSGLNSGTTYYFKAFAENANGRGYDTTFKSFTTTQILPPGGSKIRISQIYGAGGNTGAVYKSDYVELHNNGQSTESLAGFSLQYASATGTSWQVAVLPASTIPAGGYFLVRMSLDTSSNGQLLPTPDHVATGFSGLGGVQGKIALVNGSQALTACTDANIIDFVGYGAASCSEGSSPVDSLRPATAAHRKNFGCTDTDNNKADFDTLLPAPRNSATALFSCGSVVTSTLSATGLTVFATTCVGAASASQSFKLIGKDLSSSSVQVGPLAGFSFSETDNGTYTGTLSITMTVPDDTVDVFVKFVPVAASNYAGNIPVSGGGAASISVAASGQGINTPPAVTTGGSSNVATTEATCSGAIDDEGCAAIVERGIEYSTISGFGNGAGTQVKDTSSAGTLFSVKLINLAPAKTYYYKAFAKNANGVTDYGDQETFTTSELPGGGAGLTILTNPVNRGSNLKFSYAPSDIDRYIVRLYNSIGQIVYEKTFDNQQPNESRVFQFLIPGNVGPGRHTLLIGNSKGSIKAQIMVL